MNARPLLLAATLSILCVTACRPAAEKPPAAESVASGGKTSHQNAPDAKVADTSTSSGAAVAVKPLDDDSEPSASNGTSGASVDNGGSSRAAESGLRNAAGSSAAAGSSGAAKSDGAVAGGAGTDQNVQDVLKSLNAASAANPGAAARPGAPSATSAASEPPVDTATRRLAQPAPLPQAVLAILRDSQSQPGVVHQTSQFQMSMHTKMGAQLGQLSNSWPDVTAVVPVEQWFMGTENARSLTKAASMDVQMPEMMAGVMDVNAMMRDLMGAMGDTLTIRNGDTRWSLQTGPNLYSRSTITTTESLLGPDRVPELISDVTASLDPRFTFQTIGTEDLRGLKTYHVRATPKAGAGNGQFDWYSNVEAMDLWVDAGTDRLVQVSAASNSKNMMSHMGSPTPIAGSTPDPFEEAMKAFEMTMVMTTTVTSTETGVKVPEGFFTFTPPAGASEALGWDLGLEAASMMFKQPGPEVTTLDAAKAKVSFPVLVAANLPQGCQLGHVRLLSAGLPFMPMGSTGASSQHLRLVYDCHMGARFGSIAVTEGPTGEDVASMSSMLLKAMPGKATSITVSGHKAQLLAAESMGNLLVWDAGQTHFEMGWALLPDETALQVAEGLR